MIRLFIDTSIALLFMSAFYFKIKKPRDTVRNIQAYRVVSGAWAIGAAIVLLFAELSIALCYIYDWFGLWRDLACVGMLAAFLYLVLKRKNEGQTDCGCFGSIRWLNRSPLLRNLAMCLAIVCREWLPARTASAPDSTLLLMLLVLLVLASDAVLLIRTFKEYSSYGNLRAQ
ncbi:MauE/DoxX family redox-associated membrane protein [Cohnella suwonensis]|uniref:MauE/DoxX family redox-associated membrane protein n=1 Tax=Cohnella suwonensis TaxID=696072 RepID=A0ABW0M2I3_9BACL